MTFRHFRFLASPLLFNMIGCFEIMIGCFEIMIGCFEIMIGCFEIMIGCFGIMTFFVFN